MPKNIPIKQMTKKEIIAAAVEREDREGGPEKRDYSKIKVFELNEKSSRNFHCSAV